MGKNKGDEMNYIQKTVHSYEDGYENYLLKRKNTEKDSHKLLKQFKKLVKGQSILEIGFGPGFDAQWFLDNDFFYTGVDPVLKFCQSLHQKFPWINILNSDVREVEFRPETFNGIWALASLLHLNDQDLKTVLGKCHQWLQKDGILFVSLKEGRKEITKEDGRYFNLFIKNRFLDLTKDLFKLEEFSTNSPKSYNTGKENWLNFYLKKI